MRYNILVFLILFLKVNAVTGSIKSDLIFLKQSQQLFLDEIQAVRADILRNNTASNKDSLLVEIDLLTVRYYEATSRSDSALLYSLKAIDNLDKSWPIAAYVYSSAATSYHILNDLEKAKSYFDTAFTLTKQLGDKALLTELYSSLAVLYSELQDREREIEYLQKGLHLADSIQYIEQQATIRVNLSIAYNESNLTEEGVNVLHEAIAMAEGLRDSDNKRNILSYIYGNLGDFYGQLEEYDTSNVYLEKALDNVDEQDSIMQAFIYNSMGLNYSDQGEYNKAIERLQFAYNVFVKTNDDIAKVATAVSYSEALYNTQHLKEAIDICNEGLLVAEAINDLEGFIGLYYNLSKVFTALGQGEEAIQAFDKALAYKDSVRIRFLDEETAQMKIEMDLVKKELENKSLREINDQNTKTISKSYTITLLTASVGLLLLILLVFTYQNQKRIKEQKNELSINYQNLQESIQNNERLISLISHDIRGPIASLEQLLQLYEQDQTMDSKKLIYLTKDSLTSMNTLIEGLLNWARKKEGLTHFNPMRLNISNEVKNTEGLYNHQLMIKHIEFNVNIATHATVFADENMLLTILRNVLTNAIKFTPTGGSIQLSHKEEGGFDILSISDNGVGLSELDLNKLRKGSIDSKKGTNDELGTGLGILLVKDMMAVHGGKLVIDSAEGKGSTFSLYFPSKT
jgi:signal transduction histidine kinase